MGVGQNNARLDLERKSIAIREQHNLGTRALIQTLHVLCKATILGSRIPSEVQASLLEELDAIREAGPCDENPAAAGDEDTAANDETAGGSA